MIGRRLPDSLDRSCPDLQPGDYAKIEGIGWYCSTPNGHVGNLTTHTIEEHPDGTITVTPSILVSRRRSGETADEELWHGFLNKGQWYNLEEWQALAKRKESP